MKYLYNAAFLLYAATQLPRFISQGSVRRRWKARLGYLSQEQRDLLKKGDVLWFHAVSVGETRLAIALIEEFKKRKPDCRYLLTTTTPSSQEVAKALLKAEDVLCHMPLDWSPAIARFVDAVKPTIMIIMETELWPNLLSGLATRHVPVFIVNGRISDKAYPLYRRFRAIFKPILKHVTACHVQSDEHLKRFEDVGMDVSCLKMTGNMKYDILQSSTMHSCLNGLKETKADAAGLVYLLASSTHQGEDEVILQAFKACAQNNANLRLIIAPRHLERLEDIQQMIVRQGMTFCSLDQVRVGSNDIILMDVWGVLSELYAYVDIIVMGGSLVPHGGHNLAEAAIWAKPIIHGPHMHNFKDMADEFTKARATLMVENEDALKVAITKLGEDDDLRKRWGEQARLVVQKNRGATKRNVEEILQWIISKQK